MSDVVPGLQSFDLNDLAPFTPEKSFSADVSRDFRLFYVGVDDVHEILKAVFSRVRTSLYINMFGYDDPEINEMLMGIVTNPNILTMITLDLSQAGGVHEKALLDLDRAKLADQFNTHFVLGQSASHQISHTKGFVADGVVGGEGSTNWSTSGEGVFVVKGQPGGAGYVAQNNTQTIFTCPVACRQFQTRLIAEHMTAQAQAAKRLAGK